MARVLGSGCGETYKSSSNREVRGLIAPIDPIRGTEWIWTQTNGPLLLTGEMSGLETDRQVDARNRVS